jgi:hypothetical protein
MKACDRIPVSAESPTVRRGHRAKESKSELGWRRQKQNYLDVTGLVRSVQRSEGHTDCFRRGYRDCDQPDCPWRAQCFQKG